MFHKVVVANRGDAARRVIRTLRSMGIRSVAVYSKADIDTPHIEEADEAYFIGEAPASKSYLNQEALLEVIKQTGADGLHPVYGFLSENAEFATRVKDLGVGFIGPSPQWIHSMSNKNNSRQLMKENGMHVGLGSGILGTNAENIIKKGREIGLPVLVKPAEGGGGIGMFPVFEEEKLVKTVERARSQSLASFSSDKVYLEKYMPRPRHIEFQILADQNGEVRHFFERDCSLQRRHQKILEEAPAPLMKRSDMEELANSITKVLSKIGYDNIGTIEMLRGADGSFSFLEMNTRLQVEHAVTEEITGIDLVESQIRSAAGEALKDFLPKAIKPSGHAMEVRIYAEDPESFLPSPGKLNTFRPPIDKDIRVETGYAEGLMVTPYYDPLIAKVIAHSETREKTIEKLINALKEFDISGVKTNIPLLINCLYSEKFKSGNVDTDFVSKALNKKEKK
ncbi:acetyl/propionyl/methylcrotonyl-CoA carboxylase subunit alpha [Alteribacillus sp. YIM 98480]|uniref:acetyl-CoA carboxylase biotin carboxylase subunit n=1 Tax=Alteribacillus sp. YIM 98480 TaxID=2606599 RepID=UPI00131D3150|nr:biotin carboxylase N-terminal domain-containing protein [Alteribacillus sp. YIM 98480]